MVVFVRFAVRAETVFHLAVFDSFTLVASSSTGRLNSMGFFQN